MNKKERLDVLVFNKELASSRETAKKLIMAGNVLVNGQVMDKPGTPVNMDSEITLKKTVPYVSRGGLKLKKAIDEFGISIQDKVAVDIGASTGGFTDCLLQEGAKMVYSVDVGYGQLAEKLRKDSRVMVIERKNARYLKAEDIGEKVDIVTIDVSFISLDKIFIPAASLLKDNGIIISLIKPQFEAGKEYVGKNGVVKDPKVHEMVINKVFSNARQERLYMKNITYSPIKGPKGNIEFLALFDKSEGLFDMDKIHRVVEDAHSKLVGGVL
ncbi:MAG: TlyA family RNA methyltransferase [Thermoanaerobacteraceae bacterium]|nr:TlyA family RNA methyltransferase [Thermoanaerobacteraceae bacterium]